MRKITSILLLTSLSLSSCEKMKITINPEPKKEIHGPHITTTNDGSCTTLQIEGLNTKSDIPLIIIKHNNRTDSINGQRPPGGPIYISQCLENDRWIRKKWKRKRTTITVIDEDGTKTTIKGRN